MKAKLFRASLPQAAFSAKQVLGNEAKVANKENIDMYSLMTSAGEAVFQHLQQYYLSNINIESKESARQAVFVICGKGNNGGDGFIVAALAAKQGLQVTVLLTASPSELSGDALRAYQYCFGIKEAASTSLTFEQPSRMVEIITAFQGTVIVDAIFGIGFKGSLPQSITEVVNAINKHPAKVVSVDIPSGLYATTGYVENSAVKANSTVTFIAMKSGLVTGQAINHVGNLYLAELAIGHAFSQQVKSELSLLGSSILSELPTRALNSHKGDIGLLMAIGGDRGFAGAIRLSAEAALRSGSALVSVCCHQSNQALVFIGRPELMLAPSCAKELASSNTFNKAKVYVLGPGLGQNDWGLALFHLAISQNKTCVIDADGLRLLAKGYHQGLLTKSVKDNDWILTPHPGEAAALLNCTVADIERDRFSAVKSIAQQYHCVCLLKGAGSLVSDGKHVWINTTGNSGMASGGMGDVLSGIVAAFIMQKYTHEYTSREQKLFDYGKLTTLATYIHGQAADFIAQKHGKIGMLASDLLPIIQQLINKKL